MKRCHGGQEIYGQEDSVECWYSVVSGVLRRFAVRSDGRRQITDFLLPGDFFGFASGRQQHLFAVEALTKSVVACYPRRRTEMLQFAHCTARFLIQEAHLFGTLQDEGAGFGQFESFTNSRKELRPYLLF